MTMEQPTRCPICGYYLTLELEFSGCRCIDPAHWQAAGVLKPRDYYPMARVAAGSGVELSRRQANQGLIDSDCTC